MTAEQNAVAPVALKPPIHLETGAIVTLRMPGHSRTGGQEYFAPAVVLQQYYPEGQIDALVWDASAGAHFAHGFAVRDVGVRTLEAGVNEFYEIKPNIGDVLFSPEQFREMGMNVEMLTITERGLQTAVANLWKRVESLEARAMDKPVAPLQQAPPIQVKK
jgi:hypothetical protein